MVSKGAITQNHNHCGPKTRIEFEPTTTKKSVYTTRALVVEECNVISMIIPPTGAIGGVEMSNLWIIMERLSKSDCLIQILPHALPLKSSSSLT